MSADVARERSRERVKAHRRRMREQGMRLVQIWVPDTRTPEFAAEARRQSALLAASPNEREDQAFVDSISIPLDELD